MDHTKRKKFASVTMPSKSHAATFLNNKTSSVLSPIKDKVTSSKTSEIPLLTAMSASAFVSGDNAPQDTQFSFPPSMQINIPDKGSSCSSLVQTITSGASFEGCFHSSPNSEADQNKNSIFYRVGEEEAKTQVEPRNSFNFKDKGDCGCKHYHSEMKLSSTVLLEISKNLDSVLINQAIIVRSVNPDHAKSMIPSNITSIPLKTKEDFKKMETFLIANRINFEAMVDLKWSCQTGKLEWVRRR